MTWHGFRCDVCGHFQALDHDQACERCAGLIFPVSVQAHAADAPPPDPLPPLQLPHFDPVSRLDTETLRLLYCIERLAGPHTLARIQQALGVALWRSVQRTPAIAATADLEVTQLELSDGGRHLRLTADLFPPPPDPFL